MQKKDKIKVKNICKEYKEISLKAIDIARAKLELSIVSEFVVSIDEEGLMLKYQGFPISKQFELNSKEIKGEILIKWEEL